MNIWNSKPREVLCIRNDTDPMMQVCENHHLLEIGKTYTIQYVEVHCWHTVVYLYEFPGKQFNSVMFEELDGSEEDE